MDGQILELRLYQDKISSQAAELLANYKICYLAMECRTGKTLTAMAAALKYGAKSVLIVSKVKAIPSIKSDYGLMKPTFELTAINYESVHKVSGKFDLVILDEAHSIGAFPRPSQRAKTLKTICKGVPIIYLSGTPSPESFSQLYHQFWVSSYSPFKMFTNFYKWAKVFVNINQRKINGNTINDYSGAKKSLIDKYTKHLFIDYSQEEAGFDANIVERVLHVEMSKWTSNALSVLKRDKILQFVTRLEHITVLGDTPAKLLSKLHQLSSGTVIDEDGGRMITDMAKADFVYNYFRGQKIAIFYVYQLEADLLKCVFRNWTDSPEEFQRSNYKVFIAQVRSAREGVRLDTADALIFFNLEYSYLSYEQGRNRLSSKERKSPANIYFICSDCGIEADILEAVHSKQDFTFQYYKTKHNGLFQ